MQNPVKDIKSVLLSLAASGTPDAQQEAVYKYYTPNAGFHHPLARVDPGPLSRERILGIWQWYRILSPRTSIHVENVVYDAPHNILLVDVTHQFHPFFSPLELATSHALTRLTLTEDKGFYLIALQEDFYDPKDVASMICPSLASLTEFTLRTWASISNLFAKSCQVLNYWRPKKTGIAYGEDYAKRKADHCRKPNGQVEHSKNKKANRVNDKTPDVGSMQQPQLAKQEPLEIDDEYEVLRDGT